MPRILISLTLAAMSLGAVAYVDTMVRHANDRGLAVLMVGLGHQLWKHETYNATDINRIATHLVARLSECHAIFSSNSDKPERPSSAMEACLTLG